MSLDNSHKSRSANNMYRAPDQIRRGSFRFLAHLHLAPSLVWFFDAVFADSAPQITAIRVLMMDLFQGKPQENQLDKGTTNYLGTHRIASNRNRNAKWSSSISTPNRGPRVRGLFFGERFSIETNQKKYPYEKTPQITCETNQKKYP